MDVDDGGDDYNDDYDDDCIEHVRTEITMDFKETYMAELGFDCTNNLIRKTMLQNVPRE